MVGLLLVAVAATGAWLLVRDTSEPVATTSTATVSASTMQQTVSVTGTMAAASTADLDFEVSGTVDRVLVSEGDTVGKGQVLARVGDATLLAERTAARSSLAAAETQLDDDEDDDASDVQIASDEAAILAAKSDLASAREAVGDAALRSTIAGTVTALGVEVGDVVGSSSGSSSGSAGAGTTGSTTSTSASTADTSTAAVTVTSTDRFVLDATVASSEVDQVTPGLQAQITVTGVSDTVYGTVTDVGLVAETSSTGGAVFPVTITVTGTRDDLYGGTSATAEVVVKQIENVLTVPSQALESDGGTTYVEKVVDGSAVKTAVETGTAYGMSTEVVSGLAEGDVVQISAFSAPAGGQGGGQSGEQSGEQGGGQGGAPAGGMPGGLPAGGGFPGGGQ